MAVDDYRVTLGAAKGWIFRDDFNPPSCLKIIKCLDGFRIKHFKIEGAWKGINGEFFDELLFYPRDLGEMSCFPKTFNNSPFDFNDLTLSLEDYF